MVTIEELLRDGREIIKQREFNNPSLDVQLILSHLLNKDRTYLYSHGKSEVDFSTAKEFYKMVAKRNEGYPLQYITNFQEFMGLNFYICEGILAPRPDTETLVEKVINIVKSGPLKDKEIKILDIGSGSGAIGVSLGYYLKNSMVTLMDISDTAIEVSNINIKKHGLQNVKAVKGDIFNYDFESPKYTIVVSNPPYIKSSVIASLPEEVSVYEPKLALDGGSDGLDYYRQIVKFFEKAHGENAMLSVEISYDQKDAVIEILNNSKLFNLIECDKDIGGNDRVVTGFL